MTNHQDVLHILSSLKDCSTTATTRQYTLRRRRGTVCAAVLLLATASSLSFSSITGGLKGSTVSSSMVSAFSIPSPKVSLTTGRNAHQSESSSSGTTTIGTTRSSIGRSASNGLLISSLVLESSRAARTGRPVGAPPGSPLDMICTDRHEFELQVGRAMDALRDDYPYILTKNPSKHSALLLVMFVCLGTRFGFIFIDFCSIGIE
jgi:hypothetical protein